MTRKRQLLFSIQIFQTISDARPLTPMERNHLSQLTMELKQLQSMEETKWAQRSRIKWLKVGSPPSLFDLEVPFTEEEIRRAVFSLRADKVLDPDGFKMRFYQHFRQILQQDFLDIFQVFL